MKSLLLPLGTLIILGVGLLCLGTVESPGCPAFRDAPYVQGSACYDELMDPNYFTNICFGGGWGGSACGGCGCTSTGALYEDPNGLSLVNPAMPCAESWYCTTNAFRAQPSCAGG